MEIRGLTKRYGSVTALDGVSFAVEAGRICGFVGANGAGKTTTMRIVMGVAESDGGEVCWADRSIGEEERRRFGYMPEERGLYPKMRVGEQLTYFARLHGLSSGRAKAAAREWAQRLGVGERLDDRLERLSLGNQQRVQLAAALVHDPEVLVLDEPFSGLDPMGVDALSEVLADRAGAGTAVLFSSHQLDLVEQLCEDVAIISTGRLVVAGPVERLRAGERRLVRVQVAGAGDASWAARLEGVEAIDADSGGFLFALSDGADTQALLDAARGAGAVQHFGFERRSLGEIYREVVER